MDDLIETSPVLSEDTVLNSRHQSAKNRPVATDYVSMADMDFTDAVLLSEDERSLEPVPSNLDDLPDAIVLDSDDEETLSRLDKINDFALKTSGVAIDLVAKWTGATLFPLGDDRFKRTGKALGYAGFKTIDALGEAAQGIPAGVADQAFVKFFNDIENPFVRHMIDTHPYVTVGSMLSGLSKSVGKAVSDFAKPIADSLGIKDPDVLDKFVMALGFAASSYVPGVGQMKLMQLL